VKLDETDILEGDAFIAYSKTIASTSLDLDNILGDNQILKKQLDTLLNIVDKAIIITNAKGVIHSYNKSAERIIGYRKEKIIGENAVLMIPEIPFIEVLSSGKEIRQKKRQGGNKNYGFRYNSLEKTASDLKIICSAQSLIG